MTRLIPLLFAVVLIAAACGDDSSSTEAGGGGVTTTTEPTTTEPTTTTTAAPPVDDSPEAALAAARQRWADHGPASYEMTTSEICFCPENIWVNTVVNGVVTDHTALSDPIFDPGPRTMETLFDEIDRAIADGYETLAAEYDPDTGAVVNFYVDVEALMADEEYGVTVTDLTPITG